MNRKLILDLHNGQKTIHIGFRLRETRIAQEWSEWVQEVAPPMDPIFQVYRDREQDEMEELVSARIMEIIDPDEAPEELTFDWINQISVKYPKSFELFEHARLVLARQSVIGRNERSYPGWVPWAFKQPLRDIDDETEREFRLAPQYGTIYLTNPKPPNVWEGIEYGCQGSPQTQWGLDFRLWIAPGWTIEKERANRIHIRETLGRDIDLDLRLGHIPVAVLDPYVELEELWTMMANHRNRSFIRVE